MRIWKNYFSISLSPQVRLGRKVCVYRRGGERVGGKETEIKIHRCTYLTFWLLQVL